MEKPSLTETTAHLARLLKKGEQMNDHHEVGEGPDPEKTAVVALAHVVRNSLLTFDGVFDE